MAFNPRSQNRIIQKSSQKLDYAMKQTPFRILGLALLASSLIAHAQVYQWKDANGKTIVSDTPPPGGVKASRSFGGSPSMSIEKPAATSDANAPKSMADKDADFKKRQQDNKLKSELKAKDEEFAKEKQQFCEQARRQIATMEAKGPVATVNEKGEQQLMNADQRMEEIERVRKQMAENCK